MLKAIEKETNQPKISWRLSREWFRKEFVCPECGKKVVFVDTNNISRIRHFRHLVKSNCDPEPETEKHIEMKKFVIEKMNLDPEKNLEVGLGFARPDIYYEKRLWPTAIQSITVKIAIEVQHSPISYGKFLLRTSNYKKNNIYVMWIFDELLLKSRPSLFLKKAHEIYYGKFYVYRASCFGGEGGIYPVHFNRRDDEYCFGEKINNFTITETHNNWRERENDYYIASFFDKRFWK